MPNKEISLDLKQIFAGEIRNGEKISEELAAPREEENWQEEKIKKWHKIVKKFKAGELREQEMEVFEKEIEDKVKFDLVLEMMSRKSDWQETVKEIKVLADKIYHEKSLKKTDTEQIELARQTIAEAQINNLPKNQEELEEIKNEEVKVEEKKPFWDKLKLPWNKS